VPFNNKKQWRSAQQNILENWDKQIKTFAKHFLRNVNLPLTSFSLLDVGCGTGGALTEIKAKYPLAILHGCDLEEEHVKLSRERNGSIANFFWSDIAGVVDHYDVIYISNVIEHISDSSSAIAHLLDKCTRLYILVPYKEILDGRVKSSVPGVDHINTFDLNSFKNYDDVYRVEQRVISTPYAWGDPLRREIGLRLKALITGDKYIVKRELLVSITRRDVKMRNPFKNGFRSVCNSFMI
jgi:SAM-dependent methyltransferase